MNTQAEQTREDGQAEAQPKTVVQGAVSGEGPHEQTVPNGEVFMDDEATRKSVSPGAGVPPHADAQGGGAEEEMVALQDELAKKDDQLKRVAADFENFRKRSRKEHADALLRGKEDALREVLPVMDNLQRALEATEQTTEIKALQDGVGMVLRLFEDTFSRLGLERVASVDQPFDPALHEAIQQIPREDVAPGTIVREFAAGYRLGARLLRPATVVVAKAPVAPVPSNTESDPAQSQ